MVEAKLKRIEIEDADAEEGFFRLKTNLLVDEDSFDIFVNQRLVGAKRLLEKFIEKAERRAGIAYREKKFFVAGKEPPENLSVSIVNKDKIYDDLLIFFENIVKYLETEQEKYLRMKTIEF